MTITVTISSNTGTYQGGSYVLGPLTIVSTFPSLQVDSINLTGGATVETIGPVGAFGVLIEPPSTNLNDMVLKGQTSDAGIVISPSSPTLIPFGVTTVNNVIFLFSVLAITGVVTLSWF